MRKIFITIFLIILFYINGHVYSQCTVSAWPDTTVCRWSPVQLFSTGMLSYYWTPASSLSNPADPNPTAYPSATTVYQVSTYCSTGELIVNGNFESGNTGFASMYAYDEVGYLDASSYYIASRGDELGNIPWDSCYDHTFSDPTGHMMLMNGSEIPNTSIWCQTVNVVPNTDYQFSTWVTPVYYYNPPILQFSINGTNLGSPFNVSETQCLWQQFYQIWNSGTNTTANICIVNQNTGGSGNDFAIDDISFSAVVLVTASVTVTVLDDIDLVVSTDTTICDGTSATLTASGALNYSWSPATGLSSTTGPTVTATPAITTTYTVNGIASVCTDSKDIVVTVNTLNLSASSTNTSCGLNNGTATAIPSGGTGTYTYLWNTVPSQNTATAVNLSAGVYSVTVDDGICSAVESVTVNNSTGFSLSMSNVIGSTCGSTTGTATVDVSGGTAPFDYVWSTTPVQTTPTVSGLSGGIYTVTVTDAASCTSSIAVTIPGTPAVVTSISGSADATCGLSNGTATVDVSSGTAPFDYAWNTTPPQNTPTASGLAEGTYSVTVTDDASCTSSVSVTINGTPAVVASISGFTDATCGMSNGTATVDVSSGTAPYDYTWNTTPPQNMPSASGLAGGTYSVTVTDAASCTSSVSVTIPASPAVTASVLGSTEASCGLANGTATVDVSGGTAPFNFTWNTTPVQTTPTASGLTGGTYSVTVTDAASCTSSISVTIPETPALNSFILYSANATCGLANGTATVNISGGTAPYVYAWNTIPVQSTPTASGLSGGVYTVTVTDANSCTSSISVTILSSPAMYAYISGSTDASCGLANGTATVNISGGTNPFVYLWNTIPAQTTPTATNLAAGTYTVMVTDGSSCISEVVVSIQGTSPSLSAGPDTTICLGSSVQLHASGGAFYVWTPSASLDNPNISNPLATPGVSTTYQVTSYCTSGELIINGDFENDTNGFTSMYFYDDSIPLNQSGYFIAENGNSLNNGWMPCEDHTYGNGTGHIMLLNGAPDPNISIWCQTVNVTPNTDYQFSTWVTSVYYSNPPVLQFSINGIVLGTPFSVSLPECYWQQFYQIWNSGINTTANICIVNQNTVSSGNDFAIDDISFSAVVSDTAYVAVDVITNINIDVSPDTTICHGSSVGLSASGANTYYWFPSTGLSGTSGSYVTASPTVSTTYTVTGNYLGCTGEEDVVVSINDLSLATSFTATTCGLNNGTAIAIPSGGTGVYNYLWNTTPQQITPAIVNLQAGNYTIVVNDGMCSATEIVSVANSTGMTLSSSNIIPASCGCTIGSATVSISGGTAPYSYVWDTSPTQTTAIATNMAAGTYTVTVTDADACSSSLSVNIPGSPAVSVFISTFTNATCGLSNGSAAISVSSGIAPFTYIWNTNPSQITPVASGLSEGIYLVTVTDANGCSDITGVTIENSGQISLFAVADNDICGQSIGSAGVLASGGTGNYHYNWSNGDTTNVISGLEAAWYNVTVSDNLCTASTSLQVINIPGPTADFTIHPDILSLTDGPVLCTDNSTGNIVQWLWDFGDGSPFGNGTSVYYQYIYGGNYTILLMVTDINGCTDTASASIKIIEPFSFYIPDAFTPNDDGLNDVFQVYGTSISEFQMYIFNRWGDMIYHTDDYNKPWNGTKNNKGSSDDIVIDVYVYKITVKEYTGKEYIFFGRILVYK